MPKIEHEICQKCNICFIGQYESAGGCKKISQNANEVIYGKKLLYKKVSCLGPGVEPCWSFQVES